MPTDPRVMNGLHELAQTAHATFNTAHATGVAAHDYALGIVGYCGACDELKKNTGDATIRPIDPNAEARRVLVEQAAALGGTITFPGDQTHQRDEDPVLVDRAVEEGLANVNASSVTLSEEADATKEKR